MKENFTARRAVVESLSAEKWEIFEKLGHRNREGAAHREVVH
jgi:hypothetical protein